MMNVEDKKEVIDEMENKLRLKDEVIRRMVMSKKKDVKEEYKMVKEKEERSESRDDLEKEKDDDDEDGDYEE